MRCALASLLLPWLCGAALAGPLTLEQIFDPFEDAFPDGADRLGAKKAAFEAAVARQGLHAVPKAMRACEAALAAVDDQIRRDAAAYEKSGLLYWGWRAAYTQEFEKRHGRPPSEWKVPPAINDDFIAKEIAFKKAVSFKRRERSFHEWAELRSGEMLAAADGAARAKALSAFAAGLRDKRGEQRLRCAAVLGAVTDAQAAAALEKAYESERDPVVAAALLEVRCRVAPSGALPLLQGALAHAEWALRAGAVRALKAQASREAVDLLVARLPSEGGRLVDDIADALRLLTGQELGGDAAGWKGYWEGAREGWSGPPGPPKIDPNEDARLNPPAVHSDGAATFLSIATRSEAVILCIDGSVEGLWPTVREAAEGFLRALPDRASFNVLVYGARPVAFRRKMADGSASSAVEWLSKWKPEPGADPCGALEAALAMADGGKADTILFLTIAPPAKGVYSEPAQIAQEITALNRMHGVRIHCIGASEARDAYYLQEIARQFGGVHRAPG